MTGCEVSPNYPCGLVVSPRDKTMSIKMIDMKKARGLAELNSPIIFRRFQNATDIDLFTLKAREMGPIMPWKFGEILVVRDAGAENGGLNNVLSSEPMPIQKMELNTCCHSLHGMCLDISLYVHAKPAMFQWFTVATPSPENCGLTLVASSRLLFSHLPQDFDIPLLEGLTWTVKTAAFTNSTVINLQLVIPHPTLKTPCLRYHEPWPATRTKFHPTHVSIEGVDEEKAEKLTDWINALLYDRRVCYYYEWVEGDLLLNDNISMMHTRTGFTPGARRQLWRIHID